jgi:hypothetical protein
MMAASMVAVTVGLMAWLTADLSVDLMAVLTVEDLVVVTVGLSVDPLEM